MQNVVGVMGEKWTGTPLSQKRGVLMTVTTCMNAQSNIVPPLGIIVFPRKS